MSYKVSIDAGHGLNTSGKRTPKLKKNLVVDGKTLKKKGEIIHEFEFNIKVAKALAKALERCGIDTKIVNDTTGKTDTPLSTRASRANAYGSNLHISCHYNAVGSCISFQTKAKGVLVLKTRGCQSKSAKLATCVYDSIKGNYTHTYGVGVDTQWSGFTLAILRQTKMPAILIEYGFMDYEEEAMKMLQPSWYTKLAEDTCKGICKYLGVTYKKSNGSASKDDKKDSSKKSVKKQYKIITDSLNVRKGPSVSYDKVASVNKGDVLTISKISNNWGELELGVGWISLHEKYVEEVKNKGASSNTNKYVEDLGKCVISNYYKDDELGSTSKGCSGIKLIPNYHCASHNLPCGTKIYIEELKGVVNKDGIFEVQDTGGHGFDFDLYVSKDKSSKVGKRAMNVKVISWGKDKMTTSYTSIIEYYMKKDKEDGKNRIQKYHKAWESYLSLGGKLINFYKFNSEDKEIRSKAWYKDL